MPDDLGFFDYVKAAFGWKSRLGWLGHIAINKYFLAGVAIAGLVNPGFWFAGLGVEAAYLWGMAGSQRFKNVVKGRRLLDQKEAASHTHSLMLTDLSPESRERYTALVRKCSGIFGGKEIQEDRDLRAGGIGQLLGMFSKLLISRQKIQAILTQTSTQEITGEIQKATEKMDRAPEGTPLKRTLQGTLDIQKRRLENYLKAGENMKIIDAELEQIEHQVQLLAEEAPVSGDPEMLSVRLDGVMQSLQGTSKWMSEHDELFGSAEETAAPASDLLKVPPPAEKE